MVMFDFSPCMCIHVRTHHHFTSKKSLPFSAESLRLLGPHALLQEENSNGDSEVEGRMSRGMSSNQPNSRAWLKALKMALMAVRCLWVADRCNDRSFGSYHV